MDIKKLIAQKNPLAIQVGLFDLNGILRGKYLSTQKFQSALENGFGFCDVVLGGDCDDQLINGMKHTGWHSGYPDAPVSIDVDTARELPFAQDTLLLLAEFKGDAESLCPRSVLRKVIQEAESMGLHPFAGMEFEFSIFNESRESLRDKHYQHLDSLTPGNFGYSLLRCGALSDFYHGLLDQCDKMKMPLEGLHTEIGPGVLEAALQADNALRAADNAALFKTATKIYAQQKDCVATFMAKWSKEHQGQSGHIHISLKDKNGKNVFYDENHPNGMSDTMLHFLAGQQALMPILLPMVAPNVNSFVRLQPGYWAPTVSNWGYDNRTCALRVISGSPKSQRIEYRIPGADSNPYLAFAAAIASGLYGIKNNLKPSSPTIGNAYTQKYDDHLRIPSSLGEATQLFEQSDVAKNLFGESFVTDYAATRRWEQEQANLQVTQWQRERYFEII